jgi:hypothetical protein
MLDCHGGSYNCFFFLNSRHLLPMEPLFQGKLLLEGRGTVFLDLDDLAFLGNQLTQLSRVEADACHAHILFCLQTGLHLPNEVPF